MADQTLSSLPKQRLLYHFIALKRGLTVHVVVSRNINGNVINSKWNTIQSIIMTTNKYTLYGLFSVITVGRPGKKGEDDEDDRRLEECECMQHR